MAAALTVVLLSVPIQAPFAAVCIHCPGLLKGAPATGTASALSAPSFPLLSGLFCTFHPPRKTAHKPQFGDLNVPFGNAPE